MKKHVILRIKIKYRPYMLVLTKKMGEKLVKMNIIFFLIDQNYFC
jgi:hypothetical protein